LKWSKTLKLLIIKPELLIIYEFSRNESVSHTHMKLSNNNATKFVGTCEP